MKRRRDAGASVSPRRTRSQPARRCLSSVFDVRNGIVQSLGEWLTSSDLAKLLNTSRGLHSCGIPLLVSRKWWPYPGGIDAKLLSFVRKMSTNCAFNQSLEVGVLPASLTHLTFGVNFNQSMGKDVLPGGLTHLTFGCCFTKSLEVGVLPASLTHLTFGVNFNQSMGKDVLPVGLTHLTFGCCFTKSLEVGVLPASLTHLTFGANFTHSLARGVLPASLTHLICRRGCELPPGTAMCVRYRRHH
jgi:hypothetical protein